MLAFAVRALVMVETAAGIAAVLTLLSAGSGEVSADPLPAPQANAIRACTERPWPYNTCVDSGFSKRKVRLVTTDRLPQH